VSKLTIACGRFKNDLSPVSPDYIDIIYRMSQNLRIPNSERGREGPSEAGKILQKKFALPEEDISTLILVNT
jgi:hypothetical protein